MWLRNQLPVHAGGSIHHQLTASEDLSLGRHIRATHVCTLPALETASKSYRLGLYTEVIIQRPFSFIDDALSAKWAVDRAPKAVFNLLRRIWPAAVSTIWPSAAESTRAAGASRGMDRAWTILNLDKVPTHRWTAALYAGPRSICHPDGQLVGQESDHSVRSQESEPNRAFPRHLYARELTGNR